MAQNVVVRWVDLADGLVLAPERYDPRREALLSETARSSAVRLGELASIKRNTVSARTGPNERKKYLVLDTCDAAEGILIGRKQPVRLDDIRSAKKVIRPGDVIVSRLRPYLRQVAYIDHGFIARWRQDEEIDLVGSTEFFVLRPNDEEEIAFLAAYLLTQPVQQVLNASQEGGHHPRFKEDTLLNLPVPKSVIEGRQVVSKAIHEAIDLYRKSETKIAEQISEAERGFAGNKDDR